MPAPREAAVPGGKGTRRLCPGHNLLGVFSQDLLVWKDGNWVQIPAAQGARLGLGAKHWVWSTPEGALKAPQRSVAGQGRGGRCRGTQQGSVPAREPDSAQYTRESHLVSELGRATSTLSGRPLRHSGGTAPIQLPHCPHPGSRSTGVPEAAPSPHRRLFLPLTLSITENRHSLPGSHRKPQPRETHP